jgi:hypothetical protein
MLYTSLLKTSQKKASDGKTTVLDHLVATSMGKNDAVDFSSDIPTVKDAMRMDLQDLQLSLKELETGTSSIEVAIKAEKSLVGSLDEGLIRTSSENFLRKLEPFHQHAAAEIMRIKETFIQVESSVESLCTFFAEDPSCKVSTIFRVVLQLSQLVVCSVTQQKAMQKRRESMRNTHLLKKK